VRELKFVEDIVNTRLSLLGNTWGKIAETF